jgi:hypothetical protein
MRLTLNPFTGNRYAFTGGNPISRIELDGHIPDDCARGTIRCTTDNGKWIVEPRGAAGGDAFPEDYVDPDESPEPSFTFTEDGETVRVTGEEAWLVWFFGRTDDLSYRAADFPEDDPCNGRFADSACEMAVEVLRRGGSASEAMNAYERYLEFRNQESHLGESLMAMLPSGLRPSSAAPQGASPGLISLYSEGSVRGRSMINLRAGLVDDGFQMTRARSGTGYLYQNSMGEQVRFMFRNNRWEIRVRNAAGNYLDEFGYVARGPASAHDIVIVNR